jgi:hypothetical protein
MKPSSFSRHSSPRNRKAPAWGCPSVGGSSRRMAAICWRAPIQDGVQPFTSRCPSRQRRLRLWPSNALATDNCAQGADHRVELPSRIDTQFAGRQRRLTSVDDGSLTRTDTLSHYGTRCRSGGSIPMAAVHRDHPFLGLFVEVRFGAWTTARCDRRCVGRRRAPSTRSAWRFRRRAGPRGERALSSVRRPGPQRREPPEPRPAR